MSTSTVDKHTKLCGLTTHSTHRKGECNSKYLINMYLFIDISKAAYPAGRWLDAPFTKKRRILKIFHLQKFLE